MPRGDVLGNMSKRSFAFRALATELLATQRAHRALQDEIETLRVQGTKLTNFDAYMDALGRLTPHELVELLTVRVFPAFAPNTEEGCLCLAAMYRLTEAAARGRRAAPRAQTRAQR